MRDKMVVVDGVIPAEPSDLDDVREKVWSYALDQRAFGARKLLVAFTDSAGRLQIIAIAKRTTPPLFALEACLAMHGTGASAAVAFCDEPVSDGPMPPKFLARFDEARALARRFGVHLVDWFACDDDKFRPARLKTMVMTEQPDWWDVPGTRGQSATM